MGSTAARCFVWGSLMSLLVVSSAEETLGNKFYHSVQTKMVEQNVYVDSEQGWDSADCSDVDVPCRSLEHTLTQRDLECEVFNIFILSSNVELTSIIEITSAPGRYLEVSLAGYSNMTYIQCRSGSDSGFYFNGLSAITIRNAVFEDCGWRNCSISSCYQSEYYVMAIGIMESANITIKNVTVQNSTGVGLALLNVTGNILITESKFVQNSPTNVSLPGGGGLLIHANFRSCSSSPTIYNVQYCTFMHNYVSNCDIGGFYTQGGGINIIFDESSCLNHVTIANSNFSFNRAVWGGGLYSHFTGNVSHNHLEIKLCRFENNQANVSGGGSNTGYYSDTSLLPPTNKNNTVRFEATEFKNNSASCGGGSTIFSSHGESIPRDYEATILVYKDCKWTGNRAYFSAAVDVAPYVWDTLKGGYLPSPVFINSTFLENTNIDRVLRTTGYEYIGVFTVTGFTVHFNQSVSFIKNSRSALCLMSSVAIFHDGMIATFINNSGSQGGAISLNGASMIMVNNQSIFEFINNTAYYGGAISYNSIDQHDYVSSRSCFIQFQNNASTIAPHRYNYQKSNNITFTFRGNKAHVYGNAIYATSLWPCYYACQTMIGINSTVQSFSCVGNFNGINDSRDIRTMPTSFGSLNGTQPVYLIPGMPKRINVKLYDETNTTIETVFQTNLRNNPDIRVCNSTLYTGVPTVCVEGQLNKAALVTIATIGERVLEFNFTIATASCPPGYFFNNNSECGTVGICVCSALCKGRTYVGIDACDTSSFQAFISPSTWVGYYNYPEGDTPDENNLYTAPCVSHLCFNASLEERVNAIALPLNATNTHIEAVVCAKNRQGILCAKCTANNSAYYHSPDFTCRLNDDHCSYGGLFYLISEILPLTVLFTLAMAFNVSFTSGDINGFVLFCQVFNSFDLTAGGRITIPLVASLLNDAARIIYGFFNLDFFSHPKLSFCIWEGATILDVLSFKYVTTLYAFGLIITVILVMNYCSCTIMRIRKVHGIKKVSFIHGLSAFLIICYGQCAQVTCAILLPVMLYGKNGTLGPCMSKYGGILYFHDDHLPYAVPACAAAVVLLLPPMILILNPSCNKVLQCISCSESSCLRSVTFLFCSKPKPFLDSFQGCFKDDLRFFAGLYFLYRLLPTAVYMFVNTPLQGYILVESFLVSFLFVHAVFQPYVKRAHNVLDGLLLAILLAINSFTLFNYSNASDPAEQLSVTALSWSQVLLSYIPLCYIIWYVVKKCRPSTFVTYKVMDVKNPSLHSIDLK